MKNARNKTVAIIITLILLSTIAITLAALPVANAQSFSMQTYCFVGAVPNPAGVGQKVLVHYGITQGLQSVNVGYAGMTVTIKNPDNQTETLSDLRTDSTGGSFTYYTPKMVGTYYLQAHFPQQNLPENVFVNGLPAGTVMLASNSDVLALNVTEEPKPTFPGAPLPTEYWTRPVDTQLREWYTISGNWMEMPPHFNALYQDYAPGTAHILWTEPMATGGLVGGLLGGDPVSMENGDAYEGYFAGDRGGQTGAVILNGKLYYNDQSIRLRGTSVEQNVVCVDLHNGEKLWVRNWNNTRLEFGQLFYYKSYNFQGTYGFLWTVTGDTWDAYDPLSGRWLYKMTNMPSSSVLTRLRGDYGEIIIYYIDLAKGWMMKWNSSWVVNPYGGSFSRNLFGRVLNCSMNGYANLPNQGGWMWNKTLPAGLTGTRQDPIFIDDSFYGTSANILAQSINNGAFLGAGGSRPTTNVWAVSLKPGQEGTLLYNVTWQTPTHWVSGNETIGWRDASRDDKTAVLFSKELRQFYGINLETGQLAWGPSEPTTYYLDYLQNIQLTASAIAYGKVYNAGVGGVVHCYDVKTGELLWKYAVNDPYTETEISNNWWVGIMFFADGKIYLGHGEHGPNMPLPRGAPFICLNATTGDLIWRINGGFQETGWGGNAIIGDSIMATFDEYTDNIYTVGKGPSATKVEAPLAAITQGSSLVIQGKVTDISPGTKDLALTMRFPNGVPVVSDSSMSEWMLYVYKQFARPTSAAGVEVTLSVLDSNSNFRDIGTATTDSDGFFSYQWTPDIPGKYLLIAQFAGTKSYYGSYAQASFAVDEAIVEPAPEYPQPIDNTMTIVGGFAALGILIAIVGVALALLQRKR